MTFDLRDEPWIPVTLANGESDSLSLRDCFIRSEEIRRISAELPTQSFALLRLLLAICHDAIGFHSVADTRTLLTDGLDISRVSSYLDGMADRFDLFHPTRPFMQVATLRTSKDEFAGLEKLISDVPNGNPYLTVRAGRALESISPAEAALWLVHCQAFDPSGIRSAAVGDPETKGGKGYPIGTAWCGQIGGLVLHGDSLNETLRFNIAPTPPNQNDRPVWAKALAQTEQRQMDPGPEGPVELLVWQARRIRLAGNRAGVTGLVLAQGDRMTPQNRMDLEAMTAWRYSKPQTAKHGIPVYMPLKHDPDRAAWRGLPSLLNSRPKDVDGHEGFLRSFTVEHLSEREGEGLVPAIEQVTLEIVGMDYGPKEATVAELVHDTLSLRPSLLTEEAAEVVLAIRDCVDLADEVVYTIGTLASNIASAGGDFDGLEGTAGRAKLQAWAALDAPARAWLANLDGNSDPIAVRREWQRTIRPVLEAEGRALAEAASPSSIIGRQTRRGFMTAAKAESLFNHSTRAKLPLAYERPATSGGSTHE